MSYSISGKTAIVTGAANGIGLAIARHFADRGANVMFADMDEERLLHELGPNEDGQATRYFSGDLREKLTLANLLSATIDAFDRVDILVNACRQVVVSETLVPEEDGVEDLFRRNVLTALRLSQMVAKRMIKQAEGTRAPAGTIINISSIMANRVGPGMLAYSMGAAAIDQMTRAMAADLAPSGVRVNGVAFGSVMSASLMASLKENPEWRDQIEESTPMGRIASANELTETVQYLASDASAFVTGHIVVVDGGRSLLDAAGLPAH